MNIMGGTGMRDTAGTGRAIPDAVILGWLREVSATVGATRLTSDVYNKHRDPDRMYYSSAVAHRFGSWKNACAQAGLVTQAGSAGQAGPVDPPVTLRDAVAAVQDVARAEGVHYLTTDDYDAARDRDRHPSVGLIRKYVGSWAVVCEAAGFPSPRTGRAERVSTEQALADLRTVADKVKNSPMAGTAYDQAKGPGMLGSKRLARRFGSWSGVLSAAGLPSRPPGVGPGQARFTREQVVDALERAARWLHVRSLDTSLYETARQETDPTVRDVYRAFGTWAAACSQAGLRPHPGKPWVTFTDDELLGALRSVAEQLPDQVALTQQAYTGRTGLVDAPSVDMIVFRFGSWWDALGRAGLVDRVSDPTSRDADGVLEDLRAVAAGLGQDWLRPWQYEHHRDPGSMVTRARVYQRFGSWVEACRLAGIGSDDPGTIRVAG